MSRVRPSCPAPFDSLSGSIYGPLRHTGVEPEAAGVTESPEDRLHRLLGGLRRCPTSSLDTSKLPLSSAGPARANSRQGFPMSDPQIVQGGMGVGVSSWRLARAVSTLGQLGVVAGTALDVVLARRLQDGDTRDRHLSRTRDVGRRRRQRAPLPSAGRVALLRPRRRRSHPGDLSLHVTRSNRRLRSAPGTRILQPFVLLRSDGADRESNRSPSTLMSFSPPILPTDSRLFGERLPQESE
jgi:hypothetical protein